MITYNNKTYRNLQEQVRENMDNIQYLLNEKAALNQFGVRVIGQGTSLPDPETFEGEFGDAYLYGESAPFLMYIWTRAFGEHDDPFWLSIGQFPLQGPQGVQGATGATGPSGRNATFIFGNGDPDGQYEQGDTYGPTGIRIDYGDGYIDMASGQVYQLTANDHWTPQGSIKGADGNDGAPGAQGPQGPIGPAGPQGPQGDVGGWISIAGRLTSADELPDPADLQNLTLAYIVGDDRHVYIQVGQSSATATWEDMGILNVATYIDLNGTFVGILHASNGADPNTLPVRTNGGQIKVANPVLDEDAANKGWTTGQIANATANLAEKNGDYAADGLGARTAISLIDTHNAGTPAEFSVRATAGTVSIAEDGIATILEIKGNTVVDGNSLVNFTATGLKSIGQNQWDEEWETGTFSTATGENYNNPNQFRCKNLVPVMPSTTYYFNTPGTAAWIMMYEKDGTTIIPPSEWSSSQSQVSNNCRTAGNATFTTASNAGFIKFYFTGTANPPYQYNFSLHLPYPGYPNNVHKSYTSETVLLPIATYFPTGMKKAGTVSDSITRGQANTRIGVKKLKDLAWSYATSSAFFYANLADCYAASSQSNPNVLCPGYEARQYGYVASASAITGGISLNGVDFTPTRIVIKDTRYSDVASFIAAEGEKEIQYALATPTTTVISPILNLNYTAYDLGTEQVIGATTPLVATIRYNLDVAREVANLPKNYTSGASLDNLLSLLGTLLHVNITRTYDTESGVYTFDYTENPL